MCDLPEDAKIRDTTWALKQKGLGVRARLCLRDFAPFTKKLDGVFSPTPTPLTVGVVIFFATIFDLELAIGDLTTAFLHADASQQVFCQPPPEVARDGWVWLLNKAMNGMRTASADFSEFFATVATQKMHLNPLISAPCVLKAEKEFLVGVPMWTTHWQRHFQTSWIACGNSSSTICS